MDLSVIAAACWQAIWWCQQMASLLCWRFAFLQYCISLLFPHLLWPPCFADADILFCSCGFFFFSLPILSSRRLDVYHTFKHDIILNTNLECRSEMWCMWLAENTRRKNYEKNRHLHNLAQLYRAVSLQLRHISTIRKNLFKAAISPPHVLTVWWTSAH